MYKIIIFSLCLITINLQAQPGGGGGLIINKIYDEDLKEIKLRENTIQIEIMTLDSVMNILDKHKVELGKTEKLYLPPLNNYRYSSKTSGILIKYLNKEYRFDFEDIVSKNGGGYKEKIDSLVLFKPYILSKRGYYHPSHKANEFRKYFLLNHLSLKYLQYGITPYTYEKLSMLDLVFNSKNYAYNRKPKPWMENFKNLYEKFRERNFTHEEKEIKQFLEELDEIIKTYGTNDAFVSFKLQMLYSIESYKKIVQLFENHPFEYSSNMPYIDNLLIHSYVRCKDYKEAINICEKAAIKQLGIDKKRYYQYTYHKFFIEIYYQNKNKMKEIQTVLDNEEYSQYYNFVFEQLKILQAYNAYKFENKDTELLSGFDKKCIPNPILNEVYPLDTIKGNDYCPSLIFGTMRDIL